MVGGDMVGVTVGRNEKFAGPLLTNDLSIFFLNSKINTSFLSKQFDTIVSCLRSLSTSFILFHLSEKSYYIFQKIREQVCGSSLLSCLDFF